MNADFTTTFVVEQNPQEVFDAINRVSEWWQGEIEGNTKNMNDVFVYRMQTFHSSTQKIIELIPNKKVVWLVIESNLTFAKKVDEWTDTKIIFEIDVINNKTQVRFTHVGLVPQFECYKDCSGAWEQLVQKSLVSLIKTGKGKKVF